MILKVSTQYKKDLKRYQNKPSKIAALKALNWYVSVRTMSYLVNSYQMHRKNTGTGCPHDWCRSLV